jgi:hypothetical protein
LDNVYFRKSLRFFRGEYFLGLEEEISEITEARNKRDTLNNQGWRLCSKRLCSRAFFKPFCCVGVLYNLFRLSGYSIVTHYTATYLEAAGAKMDPMLGTVVVGAFLVLSSLCASFALLKISKKSLFTASGLAGAAGMIASNCTRSSCSSADYVKSLCIFPAAAYSQQNGDPKHVSQTVLSLSWVPVAGSALVTFCNSFGLLPVFHILISELFPTDIRSGIH